MLKRIFVAAIAAVTFCMLSSAASAQGRFDRWGIAVVGMNPGNSFVVGDDTWQGHATGSFLGFEASRGLQYGGLYVGVAAHVSGGVIETQEKGYVALNGLAGLNFRAGWVFGNRLLTYVGVGPDISVMSFGPSAQSTQHQLGSGWDVGLGIEYALDDHWSLGGSLKRQRLSDVTDINVRDFYLASLKLKYDF